MSDRLPTWSTEPLTRHERVALAFSLFFRPEVTLAGVVIDLHPLTRVLLDDPDGCRVLREYLERAGAWVSTPEE